MLSSAVAVILSAEAVMDNIVPARRVLVVV